KVSACSSNYFRYLRATRMALPFINKKDEDVPSCQICGALAEQLSGCISQQSGDDRGDCQVVRSVTPHPHFFHQQRSRDLRSRVTQDSRSGAADYRATGWCRKYRGIPEKYFQRKNDKPPRTQTLPRTKALPLRAPHSVVAAGCRAADEEF